MRAIARLLPLKPREHAHREVPLKRHSPRGDAAHPAPTMLSSEIPAVQLSFPFRPLRGGRRRRSCRPRSAANRARALRRAAAGAPGPAGADARAGDRSGRDRAGALPAARQDAGAAADEQPLQHDLGAPEAGRLPAAPAPDVRRRRAAHRARAGPLRRAQRPARVDAAGRLHRAAPAHHPPAEAAAAADEPAHGRAATTTCRRSSIG